MRSDDYEKLVDREVRAAIQRMQAAEDAKQQGLRTWRLPESLKVCPLHALLALMSEPVACQITEGLPAVYNPCSHVSARTWRLPEFLSKVKAMSWNALTFNFFPASGQHQNRPSMKMADATAELKS